VLFVVYERTVPLEPRSQETCLGVGVLEIAPAHLASFKKPSEEGDAAHELLRDHQRLRSAATTPPHSNLSVVLYLPVPTVLNRCGDGFWDVL